MLKILAILFAAAALGACCRQTTWPKMSTERTIMSGAYSDQRPLNDDEKELFRQATAELDSVRYTPQSVATQVVAGLNYRFVCNAVTTAREAQTYQAEVVVFEPLPGRGEPRITRIKRL